MGWLLVIPNETFASALVDTAQGTLAVVAVMDAKREGAELRFHPGIRPS